MTVRPLSTTLQEKAKKEINENPSRVEADILALKTWLRQEPHLHAVDPCKYIYYQYSFYKIMFYQYLFH